MKTLLKEKGKLGHLLGTSLEKGKLGHLLNGKNYCSGHRL